MKFVYINENGLSVEISPDSQYQLINYSGLESGTVALKTGHGYNQNGDNYYGSRLQSRVISIQFDDIVSDYVEQAKHRRYLESVFNAHIGGTLYITTENGEYKLPCRIAEGLTPESTRYPTYQVYNVSLYSPEYAIFSAADREIKADGFEKTLVFPVQFPIMFGKTGAIVEVEYAGDVPAPLLLEFRGPAVKPVIVKSETGETITVDTALAGGEILWVDTTPNRINVYTEADGVKTPAYHLIDPLSDFFCLTRGTNTIRFFADSGDPALYIHYNTLFLGV